MCLWRGLRRYGNIKAMSSRHGMSSVSSWQGVRTVQMTAQGPCHHPSTRPGASGVQDRRGSRTDAITRRRVASGQLSTDVVILSATCSLQDSNLDLGSAQQPRIDPRRTGRHRHGETQTHSRSRRHVGCKQAAARCAVQLGQGLDWNLGRDLQKKEKEREAKVAVEIRKG